ncbi:MAG: M14 family metallopeptidase [Gemmatimonadetes bacterium]|nr:M14 family metallopeptidase [Gemmatimonadota bacterium]
MEPVTASSYFAPWKGGLTRGRRLHSRLIGLAAGLALALAAGPALAQSDAMRTAPERTDHRETTRYDDVVAFMRAADAASDVIHYTTFGRTFEGRDMPLAVVGRVSGPEPEAVRASGRTIVYLQGNIHAGEVEGKEALLMLLRAAAGGQLDAMLDSLVLLVAPIYNADGNERVSPTNRGGQHGPINGMGQRPNAQGYDLNRDHMKLDSPEARALVSLLSRYDPHVGVDLHTTNGTRHAYHLTYAPPLHPSTDSAIIALLRGRWLPAITQNIRRGHNWEFYYYGNVQGQGDERGWWTFDHRPRFNNNYVGLRNRFAILSEAYAYATFADRILATRRFVDEILAFARANATEIRRTTQRADARALAGTRLAVRSDFERAPEPVEILMGEVAEEQNPVSGQRMFRRLDVRRPERMPEYGTFRPTETERVPRAYLVPPNLTAALEKLAQHGVRSSPLQVPGPLRVERFRIDSTAVAREFQQHQERTLWGAWEAATAQTVPAGTIVVPVDQPLGRLLFHLLEPRSDDGLVNWNVLDAALEGARHYPILRTHDNIESRRP